MLEDDLKNQLTIARNEINKLRKQVRNLQHIQRKEIDEIKLRLREFRCERCVQEQQKYNNQSNDTQTHTSSTSATKGHTDQITVIVEDVFRPIGIIRTVFPEKRAVPRQSSIGNRFCGIIELNTNVFTNPEHSLQGLEEYSHLWIIYNFHLNNPHIKAKVAPPRLGGERVGVFSTRSPHRPCPIGLSLVEIDKIENATISFYGTDMIDGTPVLDIKPYIPFYDAPLADMESGRISVGPDNLDFYDSRQEPDGEESDLELYGAVGLTVNNYTQCITNDTDQLHLSSLPQVTSTVRVPNWVVASHRLNVCFNEHAEAQLLELCVQKQCIVDILEADPRSVYLRTKYGSQIFTFQLSEVTVTCKFDDKAATVTVVQVRRNENVQDKSVATNQNAQQ